MIMPNEQEVFRELAHVKLEAEDALKTFQLFNKSTAYAEQHANLTHHNIEFVFYNGSSVGTLEISALTRRASYTFQQAELSPFSWSKSIKKKAEKFLVSLLRKYSLYDLLEEDMRFEKKF